MKPIGLKTYRQLLSETGRYAGRLEGYRPYRADHEPPERAVTERRAKILYHRSLAAEAERTAEIRSLLKQQGISIKATPASWDEVGHWIINHIEGSREPGSSRYAPYIRDRVGDPPPRQVDGESTTEIRPLWRSVAFDLSLLLGRHMIEALPKGRWIRDGEQPGRAGSVLATPHVMHEGQPDVHQPFATVSGFMRHALALRLRVVQEQGLRLGDGLRWVAEAAQTDFKLPTAEEGFIEELGELAEEFGSLPSDQDIAILLEQHGLKELPTLPPELSRLVAGPRR
ncbi:hypothetical protein [Neorhizobium tomejilense]|uniref:hypothetical protein n=1 Tax=Neorhizobium tomejilense TaxID=2093828 RepID=UPI000CF98D96|nr:hypothetical protein [Neorhizobium tomejilense]